MRTKQFFLSALASIGLALTTHAQAPTPLLLNVDFDYRAENTGSGKVGLAAVGQTTNDFWNFYTRDNGTGGYRIYGTVTNLRAADATVTTAGLIVSNAPGATTSASTDPMYSVYLYDLNGQPVVVTVTNLPAGQYDVLPYGADGNFEVTVGSTSYGVKTSREYPLTNPPVWTEGIQYARFQNVLIGAGQPLVLTVRHGLDGYAQLAGLQIMESPARPPAISVQPANRAGFVGGSTTFTVTATGTGPLAYQWSCNGNNLIDATNASLALGNLQLANVGNYSVLVSNYLGTANSSNAALTVSACATTPAGLVSWWRAEGDATDATGTNHGTLGGGTTYASGQVGLAFNFNGNDAFVNVPSSPALKPTGAFTVEAWVNHARTSGGNGEFIFNKGPDQDSVQDWGASISTSQKLRPHARVNGSWYYFDCATALTTNRWYHIAMVFNGSQLQGYVDGALDGYQNVSGTVSTSDNSLKIGAYAPINGVTDKNLFGGKIDEVSFYNRALTAAEIQILAVAGSVGKCTAPTAPFIFMQPVSATVTAGGGATFSVVAGGTALLSYQWSVNATNLAGATNATLNLSNLQLGDAGNYSVLVSNYLGSITSSNAALTVNPPTPVSFTNQPQSVTALQSSTVSFSVGVGGTAPFTYQWRLNGTNLPGANTSTLTLTNVQPSQAGNYSVAVANAAGATNSANATLTVTPAVVLLFDDFEPGIDFAQWSVLGQTNAGTNLANTTTPVTIATNFGGFISPSNSLWFGGSGSRLATTRSVNTIGGAVVRFWLRLANGSYPWEMTDLPGEGVVLEYAANNGTNFVELGRYDTSAYMNWSNLSVTLPLAAQTTQTKIRWRQLSNSGAPSDHWAIDDVTILAAPIAPGIVTQPTNQTNTVGQTAMFTVNASGSAPLTYQWQFNSNNLASATNAQLALNDVQLGDVGAYRVIVSNAVDTAISLNASLTVNPAVCATAPVGAVAWWPGENTAYDVVGNNHGTLMGGAAFGTAKVGAGFNLNGTNAYVEVPSSTSLKFTGPFTAEAWVNFSYVKTTGIQIVAKGVDAETAIDWVLNISQNYKLRPQANIGGVWRYFDCATTLATGVWYHVAMTYDGAALRGFVNGVFDGSQAAAGVVQATDYSLKIGAYAPVNGTATKGFFPGKIDELALYNRALATNELAAIYNTSLAGKCPPAPVAPGFTTQPTNHTVVVGDATTFTVAATGSQPLAYQWNFNGTNLLNATNATLNLANAQLSQAGNYSVTISNVAGATNSAAATLTVQPPPAAIRVVAASALAGSTVIVPVQLVANGNENAVGFTLNFDPARLSFADIALGSGASGAALLLNPSQAASGHLGLGLAQPAAGTFAAGTNELVLVTFNVLVTTNNPVTTLSFGDSPTTRQVSDVAAASLAAAYLSGDVSITAGDYEGDVTPRPNGDHNVTIVDWVQVGRYVAHLDTLTNGAEFQRADCAPADTAGDGQLKVTDWVQAGRYAAGLDVWKLAGGPTDETPPAAARPVLTPQSARTLTLDSTNVVQGLTRTFSVRLQASGNENAVGFSLNYAPASLTFVSAAVGANSGSATLNVNTNLAATGKIGCVLALPTGLNFAAGVKEIAKVTFRASSTNSGALPVAFIDSPVVRAVSDSLAGELTATYTAGTLTVNPPPALGVTRSSSNVTLSWPTYAGDFQLQAVAKLGDAWSNTSPVVNSNGGVISTTFSATNQPRFFRLQHP